ncbi:MAG: carboxypeptidase regulatory-like domain-containing protein [Acidobacteria bacterium]|nr:carboxypeptidase regulatory-like domain-containing protein [Acidobacteriota bacterium]
MRRLSCFSAALLVLIFSSFGPLPIPLTAQKVVEPAAPSLNDLSSDKQLAALIRGFTNRSTDGLESVAYIDGVEVGLQGRFQNVVLGRLDSKSGLGAGCVSSLEEANAFFGRDLETGKLVPRGPFAAESIEAVAARHGMSVDEFRFYSKMLSDASIADALAAPASSSIIIQNNNGVNEGFNDTVAAFVVGEGGNAGTTRGAQRLNVFNFAAAIWSGFLDSPVTITVGSQFNPLSPCSTSGGVLGSAGATTVHRDFSGAEFAGTWYSQALANKRAGSDLSPANPDINATFNVNIDSGCLGAGTRFYYGLDNAVPANRINLLVVVLHEIGHGMGFQTFANGTSGVLLNGFPDIYLRRMFDQSSGLYWHQMTDVQRQASALNTNNVLWDGPNVNIASGFLTAGRDAATGRVHLFTPNPFQGGSSLSHFSTAASPNLLMEPSINVGLPIDLDLTRQQMRDIGWFRDTTSDNVPDQITGVFPSGNILIFGSNVSITWTNTGGFNRNVTIELSTNGGTTYSAIATNIANTGSYSWTVPSTPTTQGRIRVREAGFIDLAGVSSSNFTMSLAPSSSAAIIAGRVLDREGQSVRGAVVTAIDPDGTVFSAVSNSFGYYRIEELTAGQSYVLSARAKSLNVSGRVVTTENDLNVIDLIEE